MKTDYYVYSHIDSNGKCFYIGKGQGDRAKHSWGRTDIWNERAKDGFESLILVNNLTEEKAYELEWKFGEQIGWENLCNQRIELGCGSNQHTHNEATRKKISEALKGKKKPFSEEHKKNMSIAQKKKVMPKSMSENISKALKGRKITWDLKPKKNGKPTTS